ncbi:DUF1992 domain-containing protein [Metabacillus sp. GX 13764]|uniref:DnaJ family domain-containing protein n=1 Tax=Metabacillus kandeliae TaxID=2900151 RepID=UPI001E46225C|nr:DUF1992 domain-containing protein [Metabacillus kandeliae]MCD7036493.1 DUF1992 domain-containing protein [Metabacillus kandeliae]
MDFSYIVSEDRIRKAIKEGEFDNLPGAGKPLPQDELESVPENLRMAYRMMKNAGMQSDEPALKKEMMSIRDLLKICTGEERDNLERKLVEKEHQLEKLFQKRNTFHSSPSAFYKEQVYKKLK